MSSFVEYNPNIINNKSHYINQMVRAVRDKGGTEFWILNTTYHEIYHFKATQISDFDVQLDLTNTLANEFIYSGIFVLHMKDNMLKLLEEVPGKIYLKKIECYRDLYLILNVRYKSLKNKRLKSEVMEKIEFIEIEFPQFII